MPVNLHAQRSQATKEALRRVALERFKRDGFANVTVTELAAEAGVTERTFFRHFPTKEAVLFEDYETQLEWLAEALARRPASENLFDAVLASVVSFPHDLEVVRQAALLRAELIGGERAAGHLRVVQASFATGDHGVRPVAARRRRRHRPEGGSGGCGARRGTCCGGGELGPRRLHRRPRPDRRGQRESGALRPRALALRRRWDLRRRVGRRLMEPNPQRGRGLRLSRRTPRGACRGSHKLERNAPRDRRADELNQTRLDGSSLPGNMRTSWKLQIILDAARRWRAQLA